MEDVNQVLQNILTGTAPLSQGTSLSLTQQAAEEIPATVTGASEAASAEPASPNLSVATLSSLNLSESHPWSVENQMCNGLLYGHPPHPDPPHPTYPANPTVQPVEQPHVEFIGRLDTNPIGDRLHSREVLARLYQHAGDPKRQKEQLVWVIGLRKFQGETLLRGYVWS